MPRLCENGCHLIDLWCQISLLLIEEGLTPEQMRQNQTYTDAFSQYQDHLKNCKVCWAGIQSTFIWAREVINAKATT